MTKTYRRAAIVRVYDRGDRTVLLGARGAASDVALVGDSAQLARAVLARLLSGPITHEALLAHLAALAGGPIGDTTAIDQLLALLITAGVVHEGELAPSTAAARAARPTRVVLAGTGAIGVVHLPALAIALQQRGHTVRVALTREARRFVSVAAIEAITHARVPADAWDGAVEAPVPHLELASWAEVVAIVPASATTLSRLATGDCSCVVSALALSTRAPVLVAPSMNAAMWSAPAIARNVAQLIEDGLAVVHPGLGVEVHDDPARRAPEISGAPPAEVLVALIERLAAEASAR